MVDRDSERCMDWSLVANLLWLLSADSDGEPFVLRVALLARNVLAFCEGLAGANLVGDGDADLARNRNALLLGNVLALLVSNLLGVGLGDLLALVVGNILASSLNRSPHLVVAITPPFKLAILLVLSGALRFSVGFVFCPVLLDADVLVDGGAFVGIFSGALLPCGGLAQSLGSGGTLLLVNRLANLFFTLLVFCIPQGLEEKTL